MSSTLLPGHRALRKGRVSLHGQVYLVTATTAARIPIFSDFELASCAARIIATPRAELAMLSWVLMPDHFHVLVALNEGSLSRAIGTMKGRIAIAVNRLRGVREGLWSRAFHDHALRHDDDMLEIARYIVCNPLRAGLVHSVREYPFWDAVWLRSEHRG
jgi:REP element-mobilizing transposase RayT